MIAPRRRAQRGTTLVELLIALVVASVMGVALLRGVVTEARMSEDRELWRNARQVARSAANVLISELRMVETGGGVEVATANGFDLTARVPYAFGVLCATNGSSTTVALLPADSVMFNAPGFSGFAWRDGSTGAYTYVTTGTSLNTSGTASTCTTAGITPLAAESPSPAGKVVVLGGTIPAGTPVGTVIFLFRRIQYEFKASAMVPGRRGLWRVVLATGVGEELAAPFNATARFRYYVAGSATAQAATPSPLSSIRGVEAQVDGRSEGTSRMAGGNARVVPLTASVYFQNASN